MNILQLLETKNIDQYPVHVFHAEPDPSLYLYTFSVEGLDDKAILHLYDWENIIYFTTYVEGKVLCLSGLGQARFVRKHLSDVIQSLRDLYRDTVYEDAEFTLDTSRLLEQGDEAFYDENTSAWFDEWQEMVRILIKEHGWEKSELRYAMDLENDMDCTVYYTEFYRD